MRKVTISLLLVICLSAALLHAESLWDATSGGGNTSESPSYRLSSTLGQAVTGLVAAGDRVAQQGFWGGLGQPYFYVCGDVTGDSLVNIADAVFILQRIFQSGPPPSQEDIADVNCDGLLTITDVVYIIQYIFGGGAVPCADCE